MSHDLERLTHIIELFGLRRFAARAAASGSTILRSSNRLTSNSRGGSLANIQPKTSGSSKCQFAVSVTRVPYLGRDWTSPFATKIRTASR